MSDSNRRRFLLTGSATLTAALAACRAGGRAASGQAPASSSTPGAPPAFNTAPPVGPSVSADTFAEAGKLAQFEMTDAERAQAAASWRTAMAPLLERRAGPRKVALDATLAPATQWRPAEVRLKPDATYDRDAASERGARSDRDSYVVSSFSRTATDRFVRTNVDPGPLPSNEADIAFAPVAALSRWIEARQITSTRLTQIYLDRIGRFDNRLRAVITTTRDAAMAQAAQADAEIAAGKYRGPLHGIPYGVKDLLDTAGIPTTYGAEPFRTRVPAADSAVVARLRAAGAVLVAKLSMGALALNDIWFGGQTMNPWLLEEGSSGSSAGPGAATAAALVAFSIGSETEGSIVSPSMRCGLTGLRPTYGRVPRTGAMTLCWSLDKLGPMTRSVEDAMLVLQAIGGPDAGDVASVPAALAFDAAAGVRGVRVGYVPAWMKQAPATDVDREALDMVSKLGMTPVEISLPDWPYDTLNVLLFAEAAAAFEELTLSGQDDQLKMQVADAWPNLFRTSRFLSAVDYVQTDRFRRQVAGEMARVMAGVDLLLVPSLRDEMLVISNFTGHPSLTLRAGFVEVAQARSDWAPDPRHPLPTFSPPRRVPHGVTLVGRLFDEGTLGRAGLALERALGVVGERPPGFD